MEGLQPTFDINGGNNCNWGSSAIGAAVGGAIGAAWGNGRWNNNGNCGNGCGCGDQYIMDTLTTMRTDINSIGRDNLMQTAALQSAMCQGYGGVNATVERVGAQLGQNQSRTEAAVYAASLQGQIQGKDNVIFTLQQAHGAEVQGMRNTFDIVSSQKDCCCETNRNIDALRYETQRQGCDTRAAIAECCCESQKAMHEEGEKTRALIAGLDRERLLRESAAKDAKIAQLEAQQYNSALAAGYAQQNRNDMQSMMANIIGHMAAFRTPATGTGAGAGAAQQG